MVMTSLGSVAVVVAAVVAAVVALVVAAVAVSGGLLAVRIHPHGNEMAVEGTDHRRLLEGLEIHLAAVGAPFRIEIEKHLLFLELPARQAALVAVPVDLACGGQSARGPAGQQAQQKNRYFQPLHPVRLSLRKSVNSRYCNIARDPWQCLPGDCLPGDCNIGR